MYNAHVCLCIQPQANACTSSGSGSLSHSLAKSQISEAFTVLTAKKIIHFLKRMIQGQEKLQGKTNCRVGPLCVDHIIFENMNIKETLNKKYPQPRIS